MCEMSYTYVVLYKNEIVWNANIYKLKNMSNLIKKIIYFLSTNVLFFTKCAEAELLIILI